MWSPDVSYAPSCETLNEIRRTDIFASLSTKWRLPQSALVISFVVVEHETNPVLLAHLTIFCRNSLPELHILPFPVEKSRAWEVLAR